MYYRENSGFVSWHLFNDCCKKTSENQVGFVTDLVVPYDYHEVLYHMILNECICGHLSPYNLLSLSRLPAADDGLRDSKLPEGNELLILGQDEPVVLTWKRNGLSSTWKIRNRESECRDERWRAVFPSCDSYNSSSSFPPPSIARLLVLESGAAVVLSHPDSWDNCGFLSPLQIPKL